MGVFWGRCVRIEGNDAEQQSYLVVGCLSLSQVEQIRCEI